MPATSPSPLDFVEYDALHLAAAQTVGADVVATADRALARAAAELGFHTAGD